MNNNSVENLLAQMSGVQSDVFSCLKRYIKVYSTDEDLRRISTQKYYDQDFNQAVVGIDGALVYGVVCNGDLSKRDDMVGKIKTRIQELNEQTPKNTDMLLLALTYIRLGKIINTVYAPTALKYQINIAQQTMNEMYVKIEKYQRKLN